MSTTLDDLTEVLQAIRGLADEGKAAFDRDRRQRWSIERLWIFAGNLAERHCREKDIDDGVDPWAELIAIRNVYAHYTPHGINHERVWADTTDDLARIIAAVAEQQPDTARRNPQGP